jgi:RND family efflux transporter MFP subunit
MFIRSLVLLLLLGLPLMAQDVQGLILPFKSVQISSPVLQEVIQKVAVDEGDTVKEGQVVVELRHSKEELQVAEAEQIEANAKFVSDAMTKLANDKMGSRDQALKSQTEYELAKIRHALAKEMLDEKFVKSPLSGIVVKKFKETGESVDRAEKMMEVVNIDQLYAQFYLDPKYLQTLAEGQPVTVRIAEMKGTSVVGKIAFLDPRIDATSGLFRVKVLLDNPERKIKAGMKAVADFSKTVTASR